MAPHSPDQRNYIYMLEAARAGIHKPILAALYAVHDEPTLNGSDTGLGISPANRIPLDRVDTFNEQVQYAANTIRSLTDSLVEAGWRGSQLWNEDEGRYSDRFLERVAEGYAPPSSDPSAARLEASDAKALRQAYLEDFQTDCNDCEDLPQNLAYLDKALLTLIDRIPQHYEGLPHQQESLLEAIRIWRKLDTHQQAIASLNISAPSDSDTAYLDRPLVEFVKRISPHYAGYPHQREALIRLTQLWRQLDSREEAIASLADDTSPEPELQQLDPALISFIQRVPTYYEGKGEQRSALTETVRIWRQLDSRQSVLVDLGIDPKILTDKQADPDTIARAAAQLDRQLIAFARRVPTAYEAQSHQRDAWIRGVQLWRGAATRKRAIDSLYEDLKKMDRARPGTPEAPPTPVVVVPKRPDRWTTDNIQIYASIIPDGNLIWAEATHGGTRMPPDMATVDAIVRIAELAQRARDRLARPFHVTSWYRPPEINRRVGGVSNSRHIVGDAIDFYCDDLTGDQIYWFLDPWWPGGLGRYSSFPYLVHIDARSYRARWTH